MIITKEMFKLMVITSIITILPRIIPFIFVKKMNVPLVVQKWLSFIPISILTAFLAQTLIINDNKQLMFDAQQFIVVLPTIVVAIFSRSLSKTVVVGIVLMAIVRALA